MKTKIHHEIASLIANTARRVLAGETIQGALEADEFTDKLMESNVTESIATVLANARAGRRGAPAESNILTILPKNLRDEVMDDARLVQEALFLP